MTGSGKGRVLTVVVCGASPAAFVADLIRQAAGRGWTVQVTATPAALAFIHTAAIEAQTGNPVCSQYNSRGSARLAVPDAVIVAPATYNTICKWAHGASDTYALGILAEMTGLGLPVIVLPYVTAALASRAPFRWSVESLRKEGVRILLGASAIGGADPSRFPWHLALDEADDFAADERTHENLT